MKPNIINKKSNFVVISYYWGPNNKNKNLQLPCPEDLEPGQPLIKEPITYGEMIKNLEKNCIEKKCNYMFVEFPEFAIPGGYQKAINYKSKFILDALEVCTPRSILYIDGDMTINQYPVIFDLPNIDFMAQGWNMDYRTDIDYICYDPYVFETSGGLMYFGNTNAAKNLLKLWHKKALELPGKADDRILSQLFNNTNMLLKLKTIQLPIEYLWFTMDYSEKLKKRFWDPESLVVEHPACLTSEEIAVSLGSDPNRTRPQKYEYQVTEKIKCITHRKDIFWEYIFFPNKKYVKGLDKFLKVLKNTQIIKLISYDKKYSPKNILVKKNETISKEISLIDTKSKTIILSNYLETGIHFSKKHLIQTILAYLVSGKNVIYAPEGVFNKSIDRVKKFKGYDFMVRNSNKSILRYKKDFYLKIDKDYIMYFRSTKILIDLIKMSKNLSDLEKNFNNSFIFISRLSCKWI